MYSVIKKKTVSIQKPNKTLGLLSFESSLLKLVQTWAMFSGEAFEDCLGLKTPSPQHVISLRLLS